MRVRMCRASRVAGLGCCGHAVNLSAHTVSVDHDSACQARIRARALKPAGQLKKGDETTGLRTAGGGRRSRFFDGGCCWSCSLSACSRIWRWVERLLMVSTSTSMRQCFSHPYSTMKDSWASTVIILPVGSATRGAGRVFWVGRGSSVVRACGRCEKRRSVHGLIGDRMQSLGAGSNPALGTDRRSRVRVPLALLRGGSSA